MSRPTFCRGTGRKSHKCDCLRCRANPSDIRLTVRHRTDPEGKPIAEIDGLPRLGALLNPEQMHEYARQLHQAAIAAQQGENGERQYPAKD